ncbi:MULTISPECIES: FCD domain-containing protein [unclassified Streptomyces]|uniref:FadR/GntR family transcriptional regulator n=1 Tax=unclassified Streptomyces TaxID=2593676 RepID=UPI000DBAB87F|nr:FCD domain-containing protein [Streptomyces sp. PsTaAH-137]MYT69541.1 FCD domain-containing protein [Streptomyces sp. SID8367]RAJ74090.1 DNA-binding FadR family transcriptional regulator [Streptomyces sp. PsTaAH-137]
MSVGPLRPSPLVEQAAERLRAQIADGTWPVGARLPGETTLAKDLGVGRSTVREALRALAGAGMVRPRQGAGVFVTATRPVEDFPARLRRAAVADVYEVRTLLEVQAARLAAGRRTDDDIAAMRAALAARRAAADGPGDAFVDADIALHATVVAAAHNPVLTDLFAEFAPALRQGLIDLLDLVDVPRAERDHGDAAHADLVDAVVAGDAETAGRVAQAELAAVQGKLGS